MQAWEQHLGAVAVARRNFTVAVLPGYGEEEVTTIDDINNVVTIPVDTHTNSNDEPRNNGTINAVNASNKQPN